MDLIFFEKGVFKATRISISSHPEPNHHSLQQTERRQERKMKIESDYIHVRL